MSQLVLGVILGIVVVVVAVLFALPHLRSRNYERKTTRPHEDAIKTPGSMYGLPVPAGALKVTDNNLGGFFKPYGTAYTSHNAFTPFPEAGGNWEKVGIATKDGATGEDALLNVYRRAIAPLQDLFEYQVEDHNKFVIKLEGITLLEDGDSIPNIPTKGSNWTFEDYLKNKWVYF